ERVEAGRPALDGDLHVEAVAADERHLEPGEVQAHRLDDLGPVAAQVHAQAVDLEPGLGDRSRDPHSHAQLPPCAGTAATGPATGAAGSTARPWLVFSQKCGRDTSWDTPFQAPSEASSQYAGSSSE